MELVRSPNVVIVSKQILGAINIKSNSSLMILFWYSFANFRSPFFPLKFFFLFSCQINKRVSSVVLRRLFGRLLSPRHSQFITSVSLFFFLFILPLILILSSLSCLSSVVYLFSVTCLSSVIRPSSLVCLSSVV